MQYNGEIEQVAKTSELYQYFPVHLVESRVIGTIDQHCRKMEIQPSLSAACRHVWRAYSISSTLLLSSFPPYTQFAVLCIASLPWLQGVNGVQAFIGLEQEFFFVPRDQYLKRMDLQLAGRTIMGKQPPRNQEVCDHCKLPYMLPPSSLLLHCWVYRSEFIRLHALMSCYINQASHPFHLSYSPTFESILIYSNLFLLWLYLHHPDMAPPSLTSTPLACMQEIQNQCFMMGIPLRTRWVEWKGGRQKRNGDSTACISTNCLFVYFGLS